MLPERTSKLQPLISRFEMGLTRLGAFGFYKAAYPAGQKLYRIPLWESGQLKANWEGSRRTLKARYQVGRRAFIVPIRPRIWGI